MKAYFQSEISDKAIAIKIIVHLKYWEIKCAISVKNAKSGFYPWSQPLVR